MAQRITLFLLCNLHIFTATRRTVSFQPLPDIIGLPSYLNAPVPHLEDPHIEKRVGHLAGASPSHLGDIPIEDGERRLTGALPAHLGDTPIEDGERHLTGALPAHLGDTPIEDKDFGTDSFASQSEISDAIRPLSIEEVLSIGSWSNGEPRIRWLPALNAATAANLENRSRTESSYLHYQNIHEEFALGVAEGFLRIITSNWSSMWPLPERGERLMGNFGGISTILWTSSWAGGSTTVVAI